MQVQSLGSRRPTRGGHGNPRPHRWRSLQAVVRWVTKSWTQLKRLSSHYVHLFILLLMDIWVASSLRLWICLYVSFGECSCSVAKSCPTLQDPMNRNTPGFPVHHQLPEFTQTHVHWVGDAIQPTHPLSPASPPAPNPSQHQGLFKWVSSSHQVAKILEFQLQHQSFQWTFRTDFL